MNPQDLARAVDVLRRGGVVAYPTDTLYGLAVDPRSTQAVRRLFAVKGRSAAQAVPLIAADQMQAGAAGELTDVGIKLATLFWPGPLSLVVQARSGLASGVTAADGSVAIRVPDSEPARSLASAFGYCITATSANLSGAAPSASPAVIRVTLGDRIDFLLDAGDSPGGMPSTLVDVRGATPQLIRAGAVPWNRVLESLE